MRLELIGLNHRTSPLEVRERAALSPAQIDEALHDLHDGANLEGVAILSTCNRTELYVSPRQHHEPDELRRLYCRITGLGEADVQSAYLLRDDEAMRHLVRVAAGLDSQLLGEVQILGQLKDAFTRAHDAGATNNILNKALLRAIEAGKDLRNRTGISQGAVSVASAAVQMAQRIFGSLEGRRVLLVGAGETARLAANHLKGVGVADWRVANRTAANAQVVADLLGGRVVGFPPAAADVEWADLVVSATSASEPVIGGPETLAAVRRRKRPLLLLDLAVPRDIDPGLALAGHGDVYLYTVDDFDELVAANLETREREARRAEHLAEKHVAEFSAWYRENRVAPTIQQLHAVLEELRAQEIRRNQKRFRPEDHEQLEKFSRALIRKVEGLIATNLRQASLEEDDLSMASAVVKVMAREAQDAEVQQVLEKLRQEGTH
ncbi:MAG TPA: glutamyl-tRNA reductase [Candidatus Krumholzibacteria bacterium]|nr:glutamyl-tRNA reductase [Candidatus Krumholzibacteria bacterium]HPD70172.1 glutamyl-tRNA reductase [Candidatus Krumholzibacteria bacterium]HRY40128.1 glutamyl-tRNA reductase [Candidatus Krumholzibacteria bacterium]